MSTPTSFDVEPFSARPSERRAMAEILGLAETDAALVDLHDYGFDPCTVSLLELLPIVELAWADGEISSRDRRLLTGAAARRPGIRGRACTQLSHWLARRPPDVMFRLCRRALREFLQQADSRHAERIQAALRADCLLVVSGGVGGLLREEPSASPEQHLLLTALFGELGLDLLESTGDGC
jgi:hypothetical protein